jgi:hypothetical protein
MPATSNSVPAQSFLGSVGLTWGLGATAYTVPSASMLVQSADTEMTLDKVEARDQRGNVVAIAFYNPHDTATIEYINVSATADNGTASIGYPVQGTLITVGADASDPISGSNWMVDSAMVRRSNTDAVKVQLKLSRYAGVTT